MLRQIFKKLSILSLVVIVTFVSTWVKPVYAKDISSVDDCASINLNDDSVLDTETINPLAIVCPVIRVLNVFMLVAGAVFVMYLFVAAYKYATAVGDPKAIGGAKNTITYAVMGFIVVIGSYTIIKILAGIFGLNQAQVSGAGPFNAFIVAVKELLCHTKGIEGIGC